MKVNETKLKDCFVIDPVIHEDARGFFMENFNQKAFNSATNTNFQFVQDNYSSSKLSVLRGLHYQHQFPQAKLVSVTTGKIFDVAVDLRQSSPSFGKWFGTVLSVENKKQMWIPAGFAHGFLALSENSVVQYKATAYYTAHDEKCILWNDSGLNISWPLKDNPVLSVKDKNGSAFSDVEYFQ